MCAGATCWPRPWRKRHVVCTGSIRWCGWQRGNCAVSANGPATMPCCLAVLRRTTMRSTSSPAAREWPVERLRAALLHELMHVRRRDLLAQTMAQAACCLYWFHPLVWVAARQLRRERERACDDAVLLGGIAAHDYAQHLIEMVRALGGKRVGAMTMEIGRAH